MNIFWDTMVLNNAVRDWIIAFSIIFCSIILLRLFQSIIIKRVKIYAGKTETTIDDFITRSIQVSVMPLLYVLAFYFGLKYIVLPPKVDNVLYVAITLVVTFFSLRFITSLISFLFHKALSKNENNQLRERQAKGILLIVQILVWLT